MHGGGIEELKVVLHIDARVEVIGYNAAGERNHLDGLDVHGLRIVFELRDDIEVFDQVANAFVLANYDLARFPHFGRRVRRVRDALGMSHRNGEGRAHVMAYA